MEAYIVAGYRTAVAKAKRGGFRFFRSDDLSVRVIDKLINDVAGLEKSDVDDVIVGCANPEGEQGLQVGRLIALRALGKDVPGLTINRYCGSGLESIAIATAKIRAGMGHVFVAGGAESMSMIPMTGYKLAPSYEVTNSTPEYLTSMGNTAEAVASKYSISREQQDEFALSSHQKASKAIDEGYFSSQIMPIEVEEFYFDGEKMADRTFTVHQDEGVRRDTSLEALARLRPAFKQGGSVTAGNSSQTSDGAAFVVVMSEDKVKELGLQPIARLVNYAVAGVDPFYMGIGPVEAIPKALQSSGLKLQDIDQIELNEAFAAQALAVIKEANLNPDIVNVNGGAIALGHPLGCTGAKLSIQLMNEMKRRNQKYGMVTACVGGGQGVAGVFEML